MSGGGWRLCGSAWTSIAGLWLLASWLALELIAKFTGDGSFVFSVTIRNDACRWSWLAFLMGFLPGHIMAPAIPWAAWFGWPARPWFFVPAWIAFAALCLTRDIIHPHPVAQPVAFMVAAFGFACGSVLWNQG